MLKQDIEQVTSDRQLPAAVPALAVAANAIEPVGDTDPGPLGLCQLSSACEEEATFSWEAALSLKMIGPSCCHHGSARSRNRLLLLAELADHQDKTCHHN